jgi:hypothetical protein
MSCFQNCTGPNDHIITQIKDAFRDRLRAVKNTLEDELVVSVRYLNFFCLFLALLLVRFWSFSCAAYIGQVSQLLFVGFLNQFT